MEQSHSETLLTAGKALVLVLAFVAVPCAVYVWNSNVALAISAVLYILLLGIGYERIARFANIDKRSARIADFVVGMALLTVMSYAIRRLAG